MKKLRQGEVVNKPFLVSKKIRSQALKSLILFELLGPYFAKRIVSLTS